MDDFLKMDIFFVVSTVAVVVVGGLFAYILVRVLRILRNVERLSDAVTEEARLLKWDIDDVRQKVRSEGFKLSYVSRLFRATRTRFTRTFTD